MTGAAAIPKIPVQRDKGFQWLGLNSENEVFRLRLILIVGHCSMPWEEFSMAATCLEIHSKCCVQWLLSMPDLKRAFEQFIITVMELSWTRMRRRDNQRLSHNVLSLCRGILGIAVQWRDLAMSGR